MNFGLLSRSCLPGPQSYTPALTHTFILLSIQGCRMICASVCPVMDGGLFPSVDCCESRLCWLVISGCLFVCSFIILTQNRVVWEGGMSVEELPLSDWPMGHFLR